MSYDRITRKIQNSKESSVAFSGDTKNVVSHSPSVNSMKEGDRFILKRANKPIII